MSDIQETFARYQHFMNLAQDLKEPIKPKKDTTKGKAKAKIDIDKWFAEFQDSFQKMTLYASFLEPGCNHYQIGKVDECACASDDIKVRSQKIEIASNCTCVLDIVFSEKSPFFAGEKKSSRGMTKAEKAEKAKQESEMDKLSRSNIRLFYIQDDMQCPVMDICLNETYKTDIHPLKIKILSKNPPLKFHGDSWVQHNNAGFTTTFNYLHYVILKTSENKIL